VYAKEGTEERFCSKKEGLQDLFWGALLAHLIGPNGGQMVGEKGRKWSSFAPQLQCCFFSFQCGLLLGHLARAHMLLARERSLHKSVH